MFTRLVDEGEDFIRAEVQLYRAQAARKALSAGLIAGLFGGGVMLAQAATVALLVGIILAIAPRFGFGWATAIVVGAAVVIAAILFKLGIDRVSALIRPDHDDEA